MAGIRRDALVHLLMDKRTILGVALLIHLLWFLSYAPWKDEKAKLVSGADDASYHLVAKVMQGTSLEQLQQEFPESDIGLEIANRPIGYPLMLAVIYTLFGEHPVVMVILQICLSLLGCWLAIVAVRTILNGNPTAGAIGGWTYTLNPLLPDFACRILTETLFVVLTILMLYLMAKLHTSHIDSPTRIMFWIGITVGVATLVRASMLYFTIFLGILIVLYSVRTARERLCNAVVFGSGVIVIVLPWLIYNKLNYNTWRPTLSGEIHLIHMAEKISPGGADRKVLLDEAAQMMAQDGLDYRHNIFARGEYYRKVVIKYISAYPQRAFQQVLIGLRDFWWRAGSLATASEGFRDSVWSKVWLRGYHIIYVLTLVIGLWGASRLGIPRFWVYYFVISTLYFMLTAGWAGGHRYRLQVFAFSLPIVASGATQLIRWWSQRFNPGIDTVARSE